MEVALFVKQLGCYKVTFMVGIPLSSFYLFDFSYQIKEHNELGLPNPKGCTKKENIN